MSTNEAWIERQPEAVRADLRAIDRAVRAAAPKLDVVESGGMLAYGPFTYRYESGREGQSAIVSIAVRKGSVAVYVNSVDAEGIYVAERAAKQLGKVKVGRSCITVKKLVDLDLAVFGNVVRRAAELGGAGQVRA
ncbi:MAG: DUF1801 domain-containing protein [Polyangiaceae bacterium]|nr:DUF1801 domain-containing protein [Polyangiaceae bacterium]